MKSLTILSLVTIGAATVLLASALGPLAPPDTHVGAGRQQADSPTASCNAAVVEGFLDIRMRALEMSELANSMPAPLEDTPSVRQPGDAALHELGRLARDLDALTMQALQPDAPLTPQERLLAQGVAVHAARLVNLTNRLQASSGEDGELDAMYIVSRLDSIAAQGWELAQLIADAPLCETVLTWNESASYGNGPACETFEPEYELAMHGACSY